MRIRIWYLLAALMVLLSVAACGAPATSAPPTSVPATAVPQAVAPTPTPASVATATTAPKAANPTAAPTSAPTAAPKAANPTAPPAQPTAATKAATTSKLDIDKLLPNAPGRAEMLDYCVGCHHIAAIAIAAKPKEEWQAHKLGHIGRTVMPDAIYDKIYDYLIINYPPDRKIPELPEELLGDWTSY